jgi:hypothetical protein
VNPHIALQRHPQMHATSVIAKFRTFAAEGRAQIALQLKAD